MSMRSLATAALLAFGVSMLPSAGFAEPTEVTINKVVKSCSPFRIPGAETLKAKALIGHRFDAQWTTQSYSIPGRSCCFWFADIGYVCIWCGPTR